MDTTKITIKEQLATLAELQQTDTAIIAIEKELAGVNGRIDLLQEQIVTVRAELEENSHKLSELKKQYRSDESEVKRAEDGILKSDAKLRSVKTNKEYQSLLKEIDESKQKISDIQDRMLTLLDQIESMEKQSTRLVADHQEITTEINEKKALILSQAEVQQKKLEELQLERQSIWQTLPSKLQTMYRRAILQGRGIGVAAVVDAVCQVCRINIPPQQYIELIRLNSMWLCPNCQRIIYPDTIWQDRRV